MYAADMAKEKQESLVDGDLEQMAQANMEERHKRLYRRKLPKQRTLKETLAEMTKAELDDVRYNLGLKGASSLKKAALVESLAEEVPRFAERWLTTVLDEEYGLFQHLLERGGCSAELRDDDLRLDYLRGIGMISCGVGEDGKLAWFLPEEIEQKLRAMDAGTYRSMAELNTETARLASGLLFYYGYLNYDQLHTMTLAYLEPAQREELPFLDFVGVMLNASCWQDTLIALPHGMKYYTLLDEERLIDEQMKRSSIDYAKLSYSQVYDAGAPDYIEATPEYKALAQYMMQKGGLDVLKAADVVGEIYIMLQNGERIDMVREFLTDLGYLEGAALKDALLLVGAYNNATRLWALKGHTPDSLVRPQPAGQGKLVSFAEAQTHKAKVGRNDPCPCGSGKKYKNCCLRKDED